ncbi:MAG TPA: hypothetical protein VE869_13010 [Gemmatimonas sp.]|nr:hypothetical protein [Gemmatimonas sp.]
MSLRTPHLLFALALPLALAVPAAAQSAKKKPGTAAVPGKGSPKAAVALSGIWAGTATVPLGDSTIVVPVSYSFSGTGATIGGIASVPGQGSGPISNVVQDGARVQFRVTAPEARLLEHDGRVGADGSIEGMVNMNNLPVARFKIAAKQPEPAKKPQPAKK